MAVPVYGFNANVFSQQGSYPCPWRSHYLEHSVLSIGVCTFEFGGRRGQKAVEEEQDDDDADTDE